MTNKPDAPDFFDAVESAIGDMQGTAEYRLGFDRGRESCSKDKTIAASIAYERGLAEANRWWAERWLNYHVVDFGGHRIYPEMKEEMDAKAAEVLGK